MILKQVLKKSKTPENIKKPTTTTRNIKLQSATGIPFHFIPCFTSLKFSLCSISSRSQPYGWANCCRNSLRCQFSHFAFSSCSTDYASGNLSSSNLAVKDFTLFVFYRKILSFHPLLRFTYRL